MSEIPVSVLITTKNEEQNIRRCLKSCEGFAEIVVIDSYSDDDTTKIAKELGVQVEKFKWNGQYPKKRQWCLEKLKIKHDWVFWLDADEVLTPEIIDEMSRLFNEPREEAGFFVKGTYIWNCKMLNHGMKNNKIALFNNYKMEFPIVDDLDIEGMGEIEGHYQPILKKGGKSSGIGQIKAPLLHYAYENAEAWGDRHKRYAHWEAEMTRRGTWPQDPVKLAGNF